MKPDWQYFELWVFLRPPLVGLFHSGGVCSMGPYFLCMVYFWYALGSRLGVHTKVP